MSKKTKRQLQHEDKLFQMRNEKQLIQKIVSKNQMEIIYNDYF